MTGSSNARPSLSPLLQPYRPPILLINYPFVTREILKISNSHTSHVVLNVVTHCSLASIHLLNEPVPVSNSHQYRVRTDVIQSVLELHRDMLAVQSTLTCSDSRL
jgi:hypothetical protein